MDYIAQGTATDDLDDSRLHVLLDELLKRLGSLRRVLLIPPDNTRCHSYAGELTAMLYERLKDSAHVEILPALGTHSPMSIAQIESMFRDVPTSIFRTHNWRTDLHQLGSVPGDFIAEQTGGRLDYGVTCEVNR